MATMPTDVPSSRDLFSSPEREAFPSCTQVTLNHGICDSKCLSCPVGRVNYGDASADVQREFAPSRRRSMSFDIFKRVADEVAQYPHAWLRIHARGEPLLHPQFIDMVSYAKCAGVKTVQAFTDAITLDERKACRILEAGLDILECSIHGHEDSYEQLMRNGQWERVRSNVCQFVHLRNQMGSSTRVVVSAVDQPGLQADKSKHTAFWSQYADEVIYRPHHSWGNRVDGVCASVPDSRLPCSQLWNRCTISPTGRILACFNSWSERDEEVLGDLNDADTSIASIWQSPEFLKVRQDHLEGNYTLPCCDSCRDWTGSSWGANSYENLIQVRLRAGGGHEN